MIVQNTNPTKQQKYYDELLYKDVENPDNSEDVTANSDEHNIINFHERRSLGKDNNN